LFVDVAGTSESAVVPNLTYSAATTEDPGTTFRPTLTGPGSLLHASFPPGSSILITRGAVVGRSTTIEQKMALDGGPSRMVRRALAGGPFVLERLHAIGASGDALIAPRGLNQVVVAALDGTADLYMRGGAFLACSHTVKLRTRLQKLSEVGSTGLFLLRAKGAGTVALSGGGAVAIITLRPGEEYVVSARHAIAWDGTVRTVPVTSPSGFLSGLMLGNGTSPSFGLTFGSDSPIRAAVQWRVTGPGRVFLRTRSDAHARRALRASDDAASATERALAAPGTEQAVTPLPAKEVKVDAKPVA
jgi:uncharacterized protein (AIM24 family)